MLPTRESRFEYDDNGWYDFYITLSDYSETKMCSAIEFVVVNSDSKDNEESYFIELDEKTQELIYLEIDSQCKKELGKGCDELFAESRKELEELIEYENKNE